MKVVLFCGGLGTRLREHSDTIPKPLVSIGPRPILWHLMRYYAHFGHKEFVLCLGYRGDMIREYFLTYNPYLTGNVTIGPEGRVRGSADSDISQWSISFVDTGLHANIGERLMAVRELLKDEEYFLANYSDQLSDLDLNIYEQGFRQSGAIAGFLSVRPQQSFHFVEAGDDGLVSGIRSMSDADQWINGGYFILSGKVFDSIRNGEELVEEPFARLAAARSLWTTRYSGFWQSMDTFKDKISYDRMWGRGELPWKVWGSGESE